MRTIRCYFMVLVACLVFLWIARTVQAGSPEESLAQCQQVVNEEAMKFIESKLKAVGECLSKVVEEIVEKKQPNAAEAAGTCVGELRELGDTRPGESLEAQLTDAINESCDPNAPGVEHTLDDILGTGSPGVAEPLEVSNLNVYCSTFSRVPHAQRHLFCGHGGLRTGRRIGVYGRRGRCRV